MRNSIRVVHCAVGADAPRFFPCAHLAAVTLISLFTLPSSISSVITPLPSYWRDTKQNLQRGSIIVKKLQTITKTAAETSFMALFATRQLQLVLISLVAIFGQPRVKQTAAESLKLLSVSTVENPEICHFKEVGNMKVAWQYFITFVHNPSIIFIIGK